jgi:hypothetical protein
MRAIRAPGRIQECTCEATTIVIRNDISLDNSNRMVLDVTCEINTTWLEGGPTPCRVLSRDQQYSSSIRANVDVCEITMIRLDDRCKPRQNQVGRD